MSSTPSPIPRPTPGPAPGASPSGTLSRRFVAVALLALVAAGFGLRLREFRHGLPFVLHSDYIQVTQAAQFLQSGSFVERSSYPATHTWAYVAADVAAFALDRVLPFADWGSWDDFVRAVQDPGVHHAIGRVYTAFVGAWLAVGVYLLARVQYTRGTALLAAAIAELCPALVLASHQVRIHVPGITLLAFAAVPLLRLVLQRDDMTGEDAAAPAAASTRQPLDARRCLLAGAAAGAVASVFQLGFVLLAAGGLALLGLRRPWRRALLQGATVAGAFAVTFLALTLAAHWPGLVHDPAGEPLLQDAATLGIPGPTLGFHFTERFAAFVRNFTLIEPVRVLAVLLLLLACWRGRSSIRAALAYLGYPLLLLLILGTNYTEVRYSMSTIVFLAPLAAAGCLSLASRPVRIVLATLLVAAPLAASLRAVTLLRTVDTRFTLDELVTRLGEAPGADPPPVIALQDALVLDRGALPAGAVEYPRWDDIEDWGAEPTTPREGLRRTGAVAYARIPGARWAAGPLDAASMERLGYRLYGTLASAPHSRPCLPDVPDAVFPDLWRTSRTGPPIDLWVRTGPEGDALRARLARIMPPATFATWTGSARDGAAAAAAAAARTAARRAAPPATDAAESAGHIDGEQLARLLALPGDRWRDVGGALAPVARSASAGAASPLSPPAAPTLLARGTLRGTEPVLLLVEGARPGARCHLVLSARELRAPCRGGLLVPAPDLIVSGLVIGADGRLPLAALWPRGTPGGLPLCAQAWIEDSSGPLGFTATNAVAGTTPE